MTKHQNVTVRTGTETFANAMLVLPGETMPGAVTVVDGRITSIDTGSRAVPPGAVDCGGDWLAPGLIELHTDNLERHMSPRPGVKWPLDAAVIAHDAELAGVGISTVFDALRVGSVISDKRARYGKYARGMVTRILSLRAAQGFRISHFLHLRAEICSETLIEELAEFGPEDRVGIVSLMDHTPGQRQFRDLAKFQSYLRGKVGMSDEEVDAHFTLLSGLQQCLGAQHEAAAVAEARRFGAVLASHDDTTAAHVAVSSAHGVRLAEFPTTREAAEACRAQGIAVMMGAPNLLRGGSHSGNVAAGDLVEAGLLDILSSDYAPSSLLMASVRLGLESGDMSRGIATVTSAPAAAVGLDDRGRIEIGMRGDLLRFGLVHDVPVSHGLWVQGRRVA